MRKGIPIIQRIAHIIHKFFNRSTSHSFIEQNFDILFFVAHAFDLRQEFSFFFVKEVCFCHIRQLSLIHISEPTRPLYISYAVFCLKKKKKKKQYQDQHIKKQNTPHKNHQSN
eukprot:TRINITY_DN2022_c0_g1_i6.p1 TRINITY_DN2022_c0_g1~~TRINITY_DN2022_c0_g1_i6.p1  ORF type:complete len:113 (-),score=12.21 TRINITY_DN2022_c0_g1_i6:55-393(-)